LNSLVFLIWPSLQCTIYSHWGEKQFSLQQKIIGCQTHASGKCSYRSPLKPRFITEQKVLQCVRCPKTLIMCWIQESWYVTIGYHSFRQGQPRSYYSFTQSSDRFSWYSVLCSHIGTMCCFLCIYHSIPHVIMLTL
jgi:hypothetical protein